MYDHEAPPSSDGAVVRRLRDWVLALPGFTGAPNGCNEKILEAIQMAWLDERD